MGSKINDTDRIDSIDKMRAEPDTLYVHHHTHFPLKLRPNFSGSVLIFSRFISNKSQGAGLTFDTPPLFSLFHRPTHGGVTHAKIFAHLGKCIVSTPIRLGHTFVAGFISLSIITQWFYRSLFCFLGISLSDCSGLSLHCMLFTKPSSPRKI